MVFVGNINHSIDALLATDTLFQPFPVEMGRDTAFLDRIHCYNPGWEIPKFRPSHFTDDYGFISDYLAGFARELRKEQHGDAIDKWFQLGKHLNQRDTIAVRKMVGGFVKLLYPNGEYQKGEIEEIIIFALEMRRRVKEQMRRLDNTGEFRDTNFSYIDKETYDEYYVGVPEEGDKTGILSNGKVEGIQGKNHSENVSEMLGDVSEKADRQRRPRIIEMEKDPKYEDINKLKRLRARITDDEIADKIEALEIGVKKIIDRIGSREDKKDIFDKFMEHYLQITISVLQKFKALQLEENESEEYMTVEKDIHELLDTANSAASEMLNDQIRGDVLDAETDISALKIQLTMDGLLEKES